MGFHNFFCWDLLNYFSKLPMISFSRAFNFIILFSIVSNFETLWNFKNEFTLPFFKNNFDLKNKSNICACLFLNAQKLRRSLISLISNFQSCTNLNQLGLRIFPLWYRVKKWTELQSPPTQTPTITCDVLVLWYHLLENVFTRYKKMWIIWFLSYWSQLIKWGYPVLFTT